MITVEFITALFYEVDEQLGAIPKHPEAHLWPSEVVTLGLLHALKGGGNRAFYRWLTRDYRPLFPRVPERTRLYRLFTTHHAWTQAFLAAPTVLGVIDTYGIELLHPMREGRSPQQIGRKGLSNHRWIVGGKLCLLLNQYLTFRTLYRASEAIFEEPPTESRVGTISRLCHALQLIAITSPLP